MLVLSRKKNESIVIDDDIKIVVVEIRSDKVRLGVESPKKVPVHRKEVFDAIRRDEQSIGSSAKEALILDAKKRLAEADAAAKKAAADAAVLAEKAEELRREVQKLEGQAT
jgi:carbon storage regulator